MNILHLEPEHCEGALRELLQRAGTVTVGHCGTQQELKKVLQSQAYNAVFVRLGLAMDAELIDECPQLRWIVTPTTGTDHIDMEYAQKKSINVISLRGEEEFLQSIRSTAELTWALLLALTRHLSQAHSACLQGNWSRTEFAGSDLATKTLGILGCGRLGRMVGAMGLAFGMRVVAYDSQEIARSKAPPGIVFTSLDEVLQNANVLSLHLPLNPETQGFMSRARLLQLTRGTLLINTARGELIDEAALLELLQSGHIGGAGLDVLAGDGRWNGKIPAGHSLLAYAKHHPNLILTPHMGGYARESIVRTRHFIAERFVQALGIHL